LHAQLRSNTPFEVRNVGQGKGYRYINPLPLPVKDIRYIDQPGLKK